MKSLVRGGLKATLLCVTSMVTIAALGQANPPEAPDASAGQSAPAQSPGQSAQPAAPVQLQPMPPTDPANFTAATPTKETVQAFLRASWGYDANRIFQVQAIQPTQVQGISRVTVLVEEKGTQQAQPSILTFLTLPDGQHLIANEEILPFGAHPFENYRTILQRDAKGPSRGPANAPLLLVEFADFQCPHCKEAQPTVERLLKDYPQARFVSEIFPLRSIHSEAEKAAEYGVCVAKIGGNEAFFKYSDAVYANQAQLTPQDSAQALASAVTAAGVDQAKVKACVAEPSTKAAVDASLHVGEEVGVNSTPTLFVNGRALPLAGIPYDQLKLIIDYDMQQGGGK
ncbi:MAG TPA: thioredoxin domain-containing protein [Acidobacteriaceae bacterium]